MEIILSCMSSQVAMPGTLDAFKRYIEDRRCGIPPADALLDTASQIDHFSPVQRADLTNLIKSWEALYGGKYRTASFRPVFYPATTSNR